MQHWLSKTVFAVIASVAFLNVNPTYADDRSGDARFSVAIGSKDQVVIFGPSGDKVAEFSAPAIAQPVKVGSSTFQLSYGRDMNDFWTVILAPSASSPTPLSFTTLNNKIDSDKVGVVTLTYSKDLNKVTVDPGYVGIVKLNDSRITSAVAASSTPAPTPKIAPVVAVEPRKEPAPAPAPAPEPTPAAAAPAPSTASSDALPKVDTAAPASPEMAAAAPAPVVVPQLNPNKTYWSEPVTPPNPKDLPAVATDEIKLVEVKGTVTVTLPNSPAPVAATEGMTIPSGSTVKTGPDGSAAAFLGGVNSARLMPQTEGTVNQTVSSNKRETLIDLKNGTVFANVGRRAGETQDFKVKTPSGVAAAKGTAYVVKAEGNQLFVAALTGSVGVSDNNGNSLGNATGQGGQPGIVNNQPGSSPTNNDAILGSLIVIANAFNSKINALEAKDPATLTPAEKTYLAQAPQIAAKVAELLNDALKVEGFRGDMPPQVKKLIEEGIIPTTQQTGNGGPLEGAGQGGGGDTGLPPSQNVNPNSPLNFNPSSNPQQTTPTGGEQQL